jgi:hypothetical protein
MLGDLQTSGFHTHSIARTHQSTLSNIICVINYGSVTWHTMNTDGFLTIPNTTMAPVNPIHQYCVRSYTIKCHE